MHTDPPLAAADIQGLAMPGLLKPHHAHLGVDLVGQPAQVAALLRQLVDSNAIASAARTLDDRARHRAGRGSPDALLMALAFSWSGLNALREGLAAAVPSPAFQAGMAARAGLLGDGPDTLWSVAGERFSRLPHLLLVLAGSNPGTVRDEALRLQAQLRSITGKHCPIQYGNTLAAKGREHFGFADGVSQPGFRGTWRGRPITRRRLPNHDPEHDLFGHPGQHLVWPGEFVLGYPASSPDPRLPGPVRPVPPWMHNGSFLVYRRLRQDVEAFHAAMNSEATRLAALPGFGGMTADRLKALLVGRWPSGAPVSRAPDMDNPALGRERWMNNDFRFDDPSPRRTLPRTIQGGLRDLPPAPADILGRICPVASHIRKVNLRDQASDMGGASATQSRRLLRVGVPYDDTPTDEHGRLGKPDRGLLFLSIQASIEDQFEFLQARWINSRVRPRGPGGNDMIVGQCAANADGKRRCTLFGEGMAQAEVVVDKDFVTMTGGGYFFVPSLSTLRALLEGGPLPT